MGGALATFKDAVNCCVATLPDEAVEVAEMVVGVTETFAAAPADTTVAVSVLA